MPASVVPIPHIYHFSEKSLINIGTIRALLPWSAVLCLPWWESSNIAGCSRPSAIKDLLFGIFSDLHSHLLGHIILWNIQNVKLNCTEHRL